jgi:photosystem II stability/assembly factor-like uncharacterized protein
VSSLAIDPSDSKHLLCGSANGGIWESANKGNSWAPRTDAMPTLAIGAITFDPHGPSRVYAGSGEGNFYASLGAGVYVSNDGGTTWQVLAGDPFLGVGFFDLVVDPADGDVLYAATTAGFFRSTDAGATWTRRRAQTCWDISVHPSGGAVEVLAAFSDGLFMSTNAGGSFSTVPLPSAGTGVWSRLAVDRCAASPDVAYVFGAKSEAPFLWRRSGTTWTRITALPALDVGQAWYDWYVAASPTDPRRVFLGEIDIWRGTLSGSTWQWRNVSTQGSNSIHPDQHALTVSPQDSAVIYASNDGGVYRSDDAGLHWKVLSKGLGITEIEYMGGDPSSANWLMAGTQDNGTIRYTGTTKWDHIADGDGGDCGVNQLSPNEVYHSYYGVSLERSTNQGDSWTDLNPPQVGALFYPPVEVSGTTVAIAGDRLVVSRNRGSSWTTVALGLTSDDAASAMRAIDANTFVIGTTVGAIVKVAWNGSSWVRTPLPSPAPRYISCVAADPTNPTRLWVTISQIGGPRVYRSDDGGASWINRTGNLPPIPMNGLVVDPADHQRIWVAADVGVYQSQDHGATWAPFGTALPNAMAIDLLLHRQDRILLCGTRNRGVWAIQI